VTKVRTVFAFSCRVVVFSFFLFVVREHAPLFLLHCTGMYTGRPLGEEGEEGSFRSGIKEDEVVRSPPPSKEIPVRRLFQWIIQCLQLEVEQQ
jgi:hypothetical protein